MIDGHRSAALHYSEMRRMKPRATFAVRIPGRVFLHGGLPYIQLTDGSRIVYDLSHGTLCTVEDFSDIAQFEDVEAEFQIIRLSKGTRMNLGRYSKLFGTLAGSVVGVFVASYIPDASPEDVNLLKEAVAVGIAMIGTYVAPANK